MEHKDSKITLVSDRAKAVALLKKCLDIDLEYPSTFVVLEKEGVSVGDLIKNNILFKQSTSNGA